VIPISDIRHYQNVFILTFSKITFFWSNYEIDKKISKKVWKQWICTIFTPNFYRNFLYLLTLFHLNLPSGDLGDVTLNHSDKSKFKAVPLQAWSGPAGSRVLNVRDLMTRAQDYGKLSALRPSVFTTRKYSWYSFLLGAESSPGSQCDRNFLCQ